MQREAKKAGAATPGSPVLWRHVAAVAARRDAVRPAKDASQAPPPGRVQPRAPERMVSAAIGRAAERVHGMPLFFDRVDIGHAALAELGELLPEQALILVIEGPAEALGAVAICSGLLASVIEMQAVGRVSARPTPMRRPTRTDGAICADLVNACLLELGDDLAALPGFEGLRGFRYASFLDDPRPLGLMLEDTTFHLLSVRLRAGDAGQRDGRMVIAVPLSAPAAPCAPAIEAAAPAFIPPEPGCARGTGALAEAVRSVPIDLVGVLCRRMISLGELRGLAPGDTIALPADVLGAATLETAGGQVLFRGKLGELAGQHALRLTGARDAEAERAGSGQGPAAPWAEREPAPVPALTREPPMADLDGPDAFRAAEAAPALQSGVLGVIAGAVSVEGIVRENPSDASGAQATASG